MSAWHGGKGSKPRDVDKERYDEEFERIFNPTMIEVCNYCTEEVTHVVPDGLSFCTTCDQLVEGNTHLRKEND